jgi:hypothetical protein
MTRDQGAPPESVEATGRLVDADWSIEWDVTHREEPCVMISLRSHASGRVRHVQLIPLTRHQAEMLRQALDEVLKKSP